MIAEFVSALDELTTSCCVSYWACVASTVDCASCTAVSCCVTASCFCVTSLEASVICCSKATVSFWFELVSMEACCVVVSSAKVGAILDARVVVAVNPATVVKR